MNKTVAGIYQGTIIEISAHQCVSYLQTTADQILELTFKGDSVLADKGKQYSEETKERQRNRSNLA